MTLIFFCVILYLVKLDFRKGVLKWKIKDWK
nr:MAG TPA_asm: hypothetical protein [Caudoviricetes sp.]